MSRIQLRMNARLRGLIGTCEVMVARLALLVSDGVCGFRDSAVIINTTAAAAVTAAAALLWTG